MLLAYPISASDPPIIEGGFWSKQTPVTLQECHLRITVRPYNARGALLVQVELATECWATPDADLQHGVTTRFLTGYAALGEFAGNLAQVLDGRRDVAVLRSVDI